MQSFKYKNLEITNTEKLDHLGLVASTIKELKLSERIDELNQ